MSEEGITRWVVFMGQYVRRGYNTVGGVHGTVCQKRV